jgi:hypothetical protein
MYKKITILILLLSSCENNNNKLSEDNGINTAIEIYRVKLSDYESLKYAALNNNDVKSANTLANHFRFTEPNEKLADFWLAITARNGSEDAASVFDRRGTSYYEFLEENSVESVLQHHTFPDY